jgi:hypothetical protein
MDKLLRLLERLVRTCQRQARENWEIAESSLGKLRQLIHSIPELGTAILEEIRSIIMEKSGTSEGGQPDSEYIIDKVGREMLLTASGFR